MLNLGFGSVTGRVTLGVRVKIGCFISDVGSDMDSGYSVRVSGLGSVLPGLPIPFFLSSRVSKEFSFTVDSF